ncbi:MAG: HI1506-related protein [Proteobacteria bacterium]|nr:HI1506-related protein [Pseudomonadota bacterium]
MAKEKTVRGILVKSKVAGFRRAGMAWGTEPVGIALTDLTREQLKQIRVEPMLVVEDADIPVVE